MGLLMLGLSMKEGRMGCCHNFLERKEKWCWASGLNARLKEIRTGIKICKLFGLCKVGCNQNLKEKIKKELGWADPIKFGPSRVRQGRIVPGLGKAGLGPKIYEKKKRKGRKEWKGK